MSIAAFEDAQRQAHEHLAAGRPDAAFHAVAGFTGQAATERHIARGLLELWREAPGQRGLAAEVKRIIEGFERDPELVMLACDALIRDAERLPPDQPPPKDGSAHTAVAVAQRCLERMDQAHRDQPETLAFLQVCLGNALRLAHLYDRAQSALTAALGKCPERGPWWFNLGLLHKQRGDFAAGVLANQRARGLMGDQRGVLWNLAICATATGDGATAVSAFHALGLPGYVTPSGMPQVDQLPPIQIRVATVGPGHMGPSRVPDRAVGFELLWVDPLSPCHGVVQTPTYRNGSVDYGDVVLWDAVPVGSTESAGRRVPRFPLLARLRKGNEHRFRFVALQRTKDAIAALEGPLPEGGQLFVHRERVEGPSSRAASTAPAPDRGSGTDRRLVYGKVVLPADTELAAFRKRLEARLATSGVELVIPELLEALGDTAAAGKAHTMWRGLERTVEKS